MTAASRTTESIAWLPGQWAVECDAGAERLHRLIARVCKGCHRLEADPRSSIAERKVGRVVELERRGQVEARTRSYHQLVRAVWALSRAGVKANTGAVRTRGTESGDGDDLMACGGANGDLVAHRETVHAADLDTGRAGARICREIGAGGLRADARDCDGLDPMTDAVDIQPDLVTGRDVGDRRHLDVGRTGGCVRREVGLRARFADRGDRGHLVLLDVFATAG